MKQSKITYLSNRVLKLNVGFLLTDGPGNSQDSRFDFPHVRVADDVRANYIRGPIRLSRTKEGVLVQAQLKVGIDGECYRCLDPVDREIEVDIEELFAYGDPNAAEFVIDTTGILDLSPLMRDEILINESERVLCRPDCKGLCSQCGTNLNHATCDCETDAVDPRLAELKHLLDRSN